jgi:hypothetical protein
MSNTTANTVLPTTTISYKDFDSTKLSFQEIEGAKGKIVKIVYDGKNLNLKLPRMEIPFGITSYTKNVDFNTLQSFDLALSFDNEDVLTIIQSIEEKIIEFIGANSQKVWGKKTTVEKLKDVDFGLFNPMVKINENTEKNYNPLLRLKIRKYDDKFNCEFYNGNSKIAGNYEQLPIISGEDLKNTIVSRSQIIPCIRFENVYCVNGKYGSTIRLAQGLFFLAESEQKSTCVFDDEDGSGASLTKEVESLSIESETEVGEKKFSRKFMKSSS